MCVIQQCLRFSLPAWFLSKRNTKQNKTNKPTNQEGWVCLRLECKYHRDLIVCFHDKLFPSEKGVMRVGGTQRKWVRMNERVVVFRCSIIPFNLSSVTHSTSQIFETEGVSFLAVAVLVQIDSHGQSVLLPRKRKVKWRVLVVSDPWIKQWKVFAFWNYCRMCL